MSSNEEKLINEYIVSFKNKDVIVETIISENKTELAIFTKKTRNIVIKDFYVVGNIRYLPIKLSSNLLSTGTLLLRKGIKPYWCKNDLLKEIQGYIYEYVDIPDTYRIIVSYYILLTYVYENYSEIPYLRVIWDYGSWKSRLLKVVSSICYNSILTTWGTSQSALFRTINKVKGTLMLDEADFWYSWTESEIIKLLNNWYQKGFPLMKADWDNFDVNTYQVFWPKIIWWRYEFRDRATESRCLTNIMEKSIREDIPTWLDAWFNEKTEELRDKLIKFRYDNFDKIIVKSDLIEWLEPRLSQIINPILSLVDDTVTEELIIKSVLEKQNEIKDDKKNSIFWWILEYLRNNCMWKNEFNFWDIINSLDDTDWRHNITHRKLWSILKQNKLKTVRKNKWTVLPYIENMKELEKLFTEYWIK